MPPELAWSLSALLAYLLGAIPFGLVVGKALRGVDIREHGSGNLGATNALRVLGKRVGALVLLLDITKGALPTLLFPTLLAHAQLAPPAWLAVALAGLTVLGHVFPVYLRFKGGKGVATSAGAFLALHPPAFGIAFTVFVLTLATRRIVSLSSLLAAAALPIGAVLIDGVALATGPALPRTALFVLACVLVWARHKANLGRILAGTEPRLGQKAEEMSAPAA